MRPRQLHRHDRRRPRQGIVLVYLTVAMIAMIAFCSLAVDFGRVQLCKTELRRCADAAARAAAGDMANGQGGAAAVADAVALAAQNGVTGGPGANVTAADVTFGNADRTQAPLFSPDRTPVNAVRVVAHTVVPLVFARVIGMSSLEVHATSVVAYRQAGPPPGMIGLNSIDVAGQASVDSYDATAGPYDPATAHRNGSVASNGPINVAGQGKVYGDARPGPGNAINLSGNAYVSGSTAPLTATIAEPAPALPGSYTSMGNYNGGDLTLAAGDYYFTSFSMGNGTITCLGPCTFYVDGNFGVSNGTIQTYQNRPANLRINLLSSAGVSLSGQAVLYADVDAPASPINVAGQADFYGRLVGASLSFSGSGKGGVHFDESLPGSNGGAGATLCYVQ